MKYFLLMLLFICSSARADVYVITDKNNAVYTASENDDTITPDGYTKQIIKGKLSDLSISQPATEYKYSNGKFTINQDRVKEKETADKAKADVDAQKSAGKAKLKALGLTDAEIDALTGK